VLITRKVYMKHRELLKLNNILKIYQQWITAFISRTIKLIIKIKLVNKVKISIILIKFIIIQIWKH
jgi:hypothetical protein